MTDLHSSVIDIDQGHREDSSARPKFFTAVLASSVGTVVEWYDFFLYATLSVFLSTLFFPAGDPTAALLLSVGALGTGYLLRPIGGLVFGHMGDRIGRKRTFVLTMMIMGFATVAIGLLPTYAQVGLIAPVALVILRLLQGLALGGEYGGAATYLAESAPRNRVGYATSWIQTTAGFGLIFSTGTILLLQGTLSPEAFKSWGWRIPFIASGLLVGISIWIRINLEESPVFAELKRQGRLAATPIKTSLTDRGNLKMMLIALFGVSAGTAAVSGVVFLLTTIFLQGILKVSPTFATAGTVMGMILGTPAYVMFGALSDRIGRRKVILGGLILNLIAVLPIFYALSIAAATQNVVLLTALVFVETVLFAMVYGPYAAFMTEVFPPQLRYTSVSLPFNLAFSLMGGLLPLVSLSLISATGNIYSGLAYPLKLLVVTIVVNAIWLRKPRATK